MPALAADRDAAPAVNETVIDAFRRLSAEVPDRMLYTYVDERGQDQQQLTFGQLATGADALATFMTHQCHLRRGDRVLLVYPPSLDFITAFVACLAAGIVPVPVYPPNPFRFSHDLATFGAIAQSSQACAVLTNSDYARAKKAAFVKTFFTGSATRWPELPWHVTNRVRPSASAFMGEAPGPQDLAFLQYTSGSTSTPKGVMITHANLMHELRTNAQMIGLGLDTRAVLWVPQYHDFGLISGILSALRGNGQLYLMSPATFIQQPAVWFEVMSRVRATHTAAPNFAFELSVRKTTPAQRAQWDLSSLQVIVSAAEPIRPATVRAFLEAFSCSRLRPEGLWPAYGLAENTVAVSIGGRATLRLDRQCLEMQGRIRPANDSVGDHTVEIAGCGRPAFGVKIRIVDPETRVPRGPSELGEIWVDSPGKAAGYYGLPKESAATFRARVCDPDDPTEYLRTGDLGFLYDDELFVAGRHKDLIIIRGRNLYPQDIEASVHDSHQLIRPGGVAAFSVEAPVHNGDTPAEQITVVAEVRAERLSEEQAREVVQAIRNRVLQAHQQECHTVVLGRPGTVLKTTSGKLRRGDCRRALVSGAMASLETTLFISALGQEPATARSQQMAQPGGRPGERVAIGRSSVSVGSTGEAAKAAAAATPEPMAGSRLHNLDPGFRRLIGEIAAGFGQLARTKQGRATHTIGTTARGYLEVSVRPPIPPHSLFDPGKRYPVLLRHANIKGFDDDAIWDGRGATLRLLHPHAATGSANDNLDHSVLDLLLSTGRCFFLRDAAGFSRWFKGDFDARRALLEEYPQIHDIFWEIIRNPDSYTELDYYSQVAYTFIDRTGERQYVRYRLTSSTGQAGTGLIDPEEMQLPLDYVPRRDGDRRSKTYLQEDFRRRVLGRGVSYLLQIQLHPLGRTPEEDADPLDCTRPWPEEHYAWHTVARVVLTALVDDGVAEKLQYNPGNSPPELGMIPARTDGDSASINHLRSIVYEVSAHLRLGQALPSELAELLPRDTPKIQQGGEVSLEEALLDAARSIYHKNLSWIGGDPFSRIPQALRQSQLCHYPAVLEAILTRFYTEAAPERWAAAQAQAPAEYWTMIDAFTAAYEDTNIDVFVESHAPICLRVLAWNNASAGFDFFRNKRQLTQYYRRGLYLRPTEQAWAGYPVTLCLDPDTVVCINRSADLRVSEGRVYLSELPIVVKRCAGSNRWVLQSVFETAYYVEACGSEEDGRRIALEFVNGQLGEEESLFKLCVARVSGMLVDAFAELVESTAAVARSEAGRRARRVCVLGAGPAGLSAAYELERRGHHVTVLERADVVGGKCASMEMDDRWYDLGGHLCTSAYASVRALATEVGCTFEPVTPYYTYDIAKNDIVPQADTLFEREHIQHYHQLKLQHFAGIERPGLNHAARALARPVAEWIEQHQLTALAGTMAVNYTAAGYGFLQDPTLPALYLLKFSEMTGMLSTRQAHDFGINWTIRDGFMDLWRRVATRLADVRCGVRVRSIERTHGQVSVRTQDETLQFDDLVLAIPLDKALELLDATDEERTLFSSIRYLDYYTTVCTIRGLPRNGFYLVQQHTADPTTAGHCAAFHHRYHDSDVFTCYSYGVPGARGSEIKHMLQQDVERMGGKIDDIHLQRKWAYFPHVGSADVEADFFERIEALQGTRNTFFTGSLLSFELVECTVAYSQELIQRYFAAAEHPHSEVPRHREVVRGDQAPSSILPIRNGSISETQIRVWLVEQIAAAHSRPASEIDPSSSIENYSLESLTAVTMLADLSEWLGWRVTPSLLIAHPTIDAMARHLADQISDTGQEPGEALETPPSGPGAPLSTRQSWRARISRAYTGLTRLRS